jgi:hypothetical protein
MRRRREEVEEGIDDDVYNLSVQERKKRKKFL